MIVERGFTLLEAVIALAIIAVSFTAISLTLFGQGETQVTARWRAAAITVLTTRLELMKANRAPLPEEETGEAADGAIAWRVTATDRPQLAYGGSGLLLQDVVLTASWSQDGREMSLSIETLHLGAGEKPR